MSCLAVKDTKWKCYKIILGRYILCNNFCEIEVCFIWSAKVRVVSLTLTTLTLAWHMLTLVGMLK